MANQKPKTVEELQKELEAANKKAEEAVAAKEAAEAEKSEAVAAKETAEATLKDSQENKEVEEAPEEDNTEATLIVHRKATWCTIIGKQVFRPGYNKVKSTVSAIEKLKATSAWKSETEGNPMYKGQKNMEEVVVTAEAKESFTKTIKEMKSEDAIELINNHGDIEDIRDVSKSDKRSTVKEAAKMQLEVLKELESK